MGNIAKFNFGTKAETLAALKPVVKKSRVLDLMFFRVEDWEHRRTELLEEISDKFKNGLIAIRSSAIGEDAELSGTAGAYKSLLHVEPRNRQAVEDAVRAVISAYKGNPQDQILLQPMLADVAMSGVVMTRDLEDGSPYYVINYDDESGKTDSITGGTGVNKTVLIYHKANKSHFTSERISKVIEVVQELEAYCGSVPLDIEFGMTNDGEVILFQVRRISVWKNWRAEVVLEVAERIPSIENFVAESSLPRSGVLGKRTILGVMPDWNPAEMIGTTPNPLAVSLYRELITRSTWRDARLSMGYRKLPDQELMIVIGGRPYIDVRNSFNSFLPAGVPDDVGAVIVDAWLDRLDEHPELHDKVEFEVAQTCLDFTFHEVCQERYGNLLPAPMFRVFQDCLGTLTRNALDLGAGGSLAKAERTIADLEERQKSRSSKKSPAGNLPLIAQVAELLDQCREMGVLPFSVLARHAFIAESFLRSTVRKEALTASRVSVFKRSIRTITNSLSEDLCAVSTGKTNPQQFLARYGHLRPSTYSINSFRYADRDDIFQGCLPSIEIPRVEFHPTAREKAALEQLLREIQMPEISAEQLLEYIRRAIAGREYAKFVFTRDLSDALELLALWGEELSLSRENVANIKISEILEMLTIPHLTDQRAHFFKIAEAGVKQMSIARAIKLGFLIRSAKDIYVVPLHRSAPNFIGSAHVQGPIVFIDTRCLGPLDLHDKLVCINNADPGFDFIFSKGIRGLITKYGGANSHMAIRCAEFGLPAAIGCGEQIFDRIIAAGSVDLNCREKVLRPLHENEAA